MTQFNAHYLIDSHKTHLQGKLLLFPFGIRRVFSKGEYWLSPGLSAELGCLDRDVQPFLSARRISQVLRQSLGIFRALVSLKSLAPWSCLSVLNSVSLGCSWHFALESCDKLIAFNIILMHEILEVSLWSHS